MKVFISQPMLGKTKDEILKDRERIKKYMEDTYKEPIEIIDSYITEEVPETVTNSGVWYMAKSLELMSKADLVFFAKDFRKGKGCIIEFVIASSYEMQCEYELYGRSKRND